MKEAERQTRSHLMELFSQHGFHPRTDLGQNFLIDLNLVEYIVREAHLGPDDVVLEVGCGTGGMTAFLAHEAGAVVSVEIDRRMMQLAQEAAGHLPNVTLLECDVLKNKNRLSPRVVEAVTDALGQNSARRLKLVANLPYSVATPVVSNLVASDLPWERMVVTIQLELALRMCARPTGGHYGALSAWLQSQCRLKVLKRLPPQVFWPRPKANSAIVRIVPDAHRRAMIRDRAFLHDFLRRLFHQRRKLMRSVLVGMYRQQLSKSEMDAVLESLLQGAQTRAEGLDPQALVALANRMQEMIETVAVAHTKPS